MKINYWHYWFEKYETDENGKRYLNESKRYNVNLPKLLNNFSEFDNIPFKKKFRESKNSDDMLVLSRRSNAYDSAFMLLRTKYSEIYKTIKDNDLSVGDIESALKEKGESIAFASYFGINNEIITMASTMSSPTIKGISDFIKILFRELRIDNLEFKCAPVCGTITKDDLKNFSFIGETEIRLPIVSNDGKAILEYITGSPSDKTQVRYITVKISMERGGNLKDEIDQIVEKTLDESQRFKLKAKTELDGKLLDYFLTEQGQKHKVIPKPKSDRDALVEVRAALSDDSFSLDNLKQGRDYETLDENHYIFHFIGSSDWNTYI